MKKSEEINLSEQIQHIESYAKRHQEIDSFYTSINSLSLVSVQDLSFEKDIELFRELTFILSVIMSIISKPHLNNRRDEIIARSGEAASISEEDFLKTLRDSSLWKDDGFGIMPEYVYYHQYEDELKIYENIFIVCLINEIAYLVDQYQSLYVSLLAIADYHVDSLVLDESAQENALEAVNKLSRRINQIKQTYFYKEVSKAKNKPKVFYPNNVLVHDRLYNLCYKFYKKSHIYEDEKDINDELYLYYFTLILRNLKAKGFEVDTRNKSIIYQDKKFSLPKKMIFTNSEIRITISLNEVNHSFLFEYKDKLDDASSSHLLIVDSDATFKDINNDIKNYIDVMSFEFISLWHLGELIDENVRLTNQTLLNENKLVSTFIDSHHYVIDGSEKLYSSYCPSCKSKNLTSMGGFIICSDCYTIYKFMKNKAGKAMNKIIFARLNNK